MSIKGKIAAFQVFFILIFLITIGLAFFAMSYVDQFIHRVQAAHKQLATITALSLHENRYAEQIAEMLLFGQEGRREFEEARRDLETSFTLLEQLTAEDVEAVETEEERERERRELNRIQEMKALTDRMHATALDLLRGREEEAYSRYYAEIEEGLYDELQNLISRAIAGEAEEVRQVDANVDSLTPP
jgi:two-component system, OmpR family, sensor kinase